MTTAHNPTLRHLNDCGCCEGLAAQTPIDVANRPGLAVIAYRVGTHAPFKQTMMARLSGSERTALRGLNTRDDDDFTIALLDAWATVADVLTFYQERIANEAYLRTATERLSLLELARLISYELRPGVAASTYLAFTIEETPGAFGQALNATTQNAPGPPPPVPIAAGMKVQSIPGPGEAAQTFETVESIEARAAWNAMKPRLTIRHPIRQDDAILYFAGLATGLRPGDGLLVTPDDGSDPVFRQVAEVTLENTKDRSKVRLQPLPGSATTPIASSRVAPTATVARSTSPGSATAGFFSSVSTPGPVAKPFFGKTINEPDLHAASLSGKFQLMDLFDNLVAIQPPPPSVLALRTRAAIFGHNAPKWETLPVIQRIGEYRAIEDQNDIPFPNVRFIDGPYSTRTDSWAEQNLANYPDPDNQELPTSTNIYLDNVYPGIVEDSWIVLKAGNQSRAYQVDRTAEISKSDFTLSAKITRLTLNNSSEFSLFGIRETTVFAQSEALALARLPIEKAVSGKAIDLNSWVDGLFQGQSIMVCGELDNERGVRTCEVATIDKIDQVLGIDGFTRITLRDELDNAYVRDTVMIHANVALATHGESTREVLGSGDAGQSFQRFILRQPPLTYVGASTPSGVQTTLKVRVNGLLWQEVPTFFGHGPDERIYVTHTDNDGNTTVMFGDGKTGARLPTGQENVTATYRKGIGLAGLLKANQLTQLLTRPLGVKEVTNPVAPNGAADRENLSEARRNAPLTVLTLDRIVSLQDYEDFARAFAGIDKALATWTWRGQTRGVFVTVAGPNGAEVPSDSTLYGNLLEAMQQVRDPTVPLEVASYEPRLFQLSAAVRVHPDYLSVQVFAMIEQRLREHFSFEARSFGQPVHFSEVVAIMQHVPGVQAVTIKTLYRTDANADQEAGLTAPLESSRPHPGVDTGFAAELLTLDPRPIELEVLT